MAPIARTLADFESVRSVFPLHMGQPGNSATYPGGQVVDSRPLTVDAGMSRPCSNLHAYPSLSVVPPRSDSLMYLPSYSLMGAAPTRSSFPPYADLSSVPPQQRTQSAIKGFDERGLLNINRGLSMIPENISESQSLTAFDHYVSEVLLPGLPHLHWVLWRLVLCQSLLLDQSLYQLLLRPSLTSQVWFRRRHWLVLVSQLLRRRCPSCRLRRPSSLVSSCQLRRPLWSSTLERRLL